MDSTQNPDIPYLSSTLIRDALLDELQAADRHRLTLVSAPPGYGKTTLIAQFVQTTRLAVAWHTITERERDLPNLHLHAIQSLEQVIPEIQPLKQFTSRDSAHDLGLKIAYFLRDHLEQDIFYILDDVHYLIGSLAAEQWLTTLVESMPPRCHMIIISRVLPDLPLVEMIARREILAIGQEKLCFSPDEIQILSEQLAGKTLSSELLEKIAALEGWPAGIILALKPLPAEVSFSLRGTGPEALFSFLASSMLQLQLPDIRNFLLASSVITYITPEICSKVLGIPNSHELLASVLNQQLFTSRVSGGIIYHQLFRDFLQTELKQTAPEQFARLHLSAAQWFQSNEQLDTAFTHYLAAGRPEYAAQIAEFVAQDYFVQGKVETLLEWKEELIPCGIPIPNLLHKCAIIHADRYQYDLAEADLAQASESFEEGNDTEGLLLVDFQKAVINLQRGNYHEAAHQAEALNKLPIENVNLRGRILRTLGIANFRLGHLDRAAEYLEAALPLHRQYGDSYAVANLLQDLGAVHLQSNRFSEAGGCLQEVVAILRSLNNPIPLALALNNLGYYYHLQGNYVQAFQAFQEGLRSVTQVTNPRAEGYLLWSFGDLLRDCGNFKQALHLYQKSIQLIGNHEPSLKVAVVTSLSTLRRWQGRWDEAVSLAEEAATMAESLGLEYEKQAAQASLWVAHANRGESTQALDKLVRIRDKLRSQNNQIEFVRVSGLCAHVALIRSDSLAAENFLRAVAHPIIQPLVAEIMYAPALQSFVKARAEKYPQLVQALAQLEAQSQESQESSANAEIQKTYSLRVFTLGKQDVIERDGQVILASEWQAARARELFYYLLFMGPTTREQICLVFWPDSSTRRVRSNFHTTLYRARKAIGEDVIVYHDDMYRINPEIKVWCDVHEMERFIHLASHLSPQNPRTEDLWRKSINLYRGDFLPLIDSPWPVPLREALRESYVQALIGLAACSQVRHDYKEALTVLKIALNIDPYREEVHRAIMSAYAQQGEKRKLREHYESLKHLLREELAVLPSEETVSLARTLLNS